MKLALIPPNSLHRWITATDLHLMLPWQLADLPEAFTRALPGYKILDNGAAESNTYSLNALINRAQAFGMNEIVLPDKLKDAHSTIDNAREAKRIKELLPGVSIMAVVQGTDLGQVMKCVYAYAGWEHIDVIGIPRVLTQQFGQMTRVQLLEALHKDPDLSTVQAHCLGANYMFPEEMRLLAQLPNVRSMDTSMPFVYAIAGRQIEYGPGKASLSRPEGYFGLEVTNPVRTLVERNVDVCLRWAEAS